MKRTVVIFGLISGAVSSAMMFITLPFINRGVINFDNGEVIGHTSIFLSFLLVFFGIRSYRVNNGGTITFGRAFAVGILITLISCVFYVVSWEILYYSFMPDFVEKYSQAAITKMRAKGASDAAIVAKKKEMDQLKAMYDNPAINAAGDVPRAAAGRIDRYARFVGNSKEAQRCANGELLRAVEKTAK